jgi:hypothetical protein
MLLSRGPWILTVFFLLAGLPTQADEPKPVDIGSRLELLLDDHLIERMPGLAFKLHTPQKAERTLEFDAPWERRYCDYVTVFKDGDLFRMYYANHLDAVFSNTPPGERTGESWVGENQVTCYAESRDGIHWKKPSFGLVKIQGSTDNNVILHGITSHNFSPFRDPRPDIPAQERYKGIGGLAEGPQVYASADAIHWRRLREQPILTKDHPAFERHKVARWGGDGPFAVFDSQNIAFWDSQTQRYLFYFRAWLYNDYTGTAKGKGLRTIFRSTSNDFLNWNDPEPVDLGGSPMEHLYTSAITPYFRAPHLYLSFPMRYADAHPPLVDDVAGGGVTDSVFMFSRNGLNFSRRYMEAFLRPGRDRRNWTKHSVMMPWGLLETAPDEISFYVTQHHELPTSHLRRFVLRTDGFVSVQAPHAGGEFTTRPLIFSGEHLVVNVSTSAVGSVRIEIQNAEGKPIDGYRLEESQEFYGDEIAYTAQWKDGNSVGKLAGKPVRLRVQMRDADMYSFRFSAAGK